MASWLTVHLCGQTFTLAEPQTHVMIGRDPQVCDFALSDGSLSRRHAEIWIDDGRTLIRDLGSSHGTWVDGVSIGSEVVALRPGQQVFLGPYPVAIVWPDGGATLLGMSMPPGLRDALAGAMALPENALVNPTAAPSESGKLRAAHSIQVPFGALAALAPDFDQVLPSHRAGATLPPPGATAADRSPDAAVTRAGPAMAHRRVGKQDGHVLAVAIERLAFASGESVNGFVEFEAKHSLQVASISVELVERNWDGRKLVRERAMLTPRARQISPDNVFVASFALTIPRPTAQQVARAKRHFIVRAVVDFAADYDLTCEHFVDVIAD